MSEWFQWLIGVAAFGAFGRTCDVNNELIAVILCVIFAIYCAIQCIRAVIRDNDTP